MAFYLLRPIALLLLAVGAGCATGHRAGDPVRGDSPSSGGDSIEAVLDSAAVVAAIRLIQVLPISTFVQAAPGDTVLFRAVAEVDTVYAAASDSPRNGGRLTYTFPASFAPSWRKAWPEGGAFLVALTPSDSSAFGRAPWRAVGSWPLTPDLRAFASEWRARTDRASGSDPEGR